MNFSNDNLPDRVWNALKTWATIQSQLDAFPSIEQCVAQVRRIVASYVGSPGALPDAVVEFYASETLDMVRKLRDRFDADDGIDDTSLEPVL